MNQPVYRFAPSPNGFLHLGHAYSALTCFNRARRVAGRFLLRVEDIDIGRSRPEFEAAIYEDLPWLGIDWEEPVRRQSEHFDDYRAAADRLQELGLLYHCFATRREIADVVANRPDWPRDPDGAPLYPGLWKGAGAAAIGEVHSTTGPPAMRLDMAAALAAIGGPVHWREDGELVTADPAAWGDVVILRKDVPASYHLAVTVDDHLQGVTHVVRGRDLYHATAVHRVLQMLLGFEAHDYFHHRLIEADDGRKLSKSAGDRSIRALRQEGASPQDIRRLLGLEHQQQGKPG